MKKTGAFLLSLLVLVMLLPINTMAMVISSGGYPTGGYTYVQYNANAPEGAIVTGMPDGVKRYAVYKHVTDRPGNIPDTVYYYFKYTAPSAPECLGYEFGGWYKNVECTTSFSNEDTGHGEKNPLQLYAKWIPVPGAENMKYITRLSLDSIPQTTFDLDITVARMKESADDIAIIALYSAEGQFIEMAVETLGEEQTQTFTLSRDNGDGKIGSIKVFILDSITNPIPLAEAVEI